MRKKEFEARRQELMEMPKKMTPRKRTKKKEDGKEPVKRKRGNKATQQQQQQQQQGTGMSLPGPLISSPGLTTPGASPAKNGDDMQLDMAAINEQIISMLRALPRQSLEEPQVWDCHCVPHSVRTV